MQNYRIKRNGSTSFFRIPPKVQLFSLCLMGAMFLRSPASLQAESTPATQTAIIAYVFPQNEVIQPGEIAAGKLTRINYAFANLKAGRIVEGFPSDAQNYAAMLALKKQNPSLTVLVSVGGWLWSGNFSDMALTERRRALFIQSAVEFIKRYQLDGLDIDWEYPGQVGAGNRFRRVDKQNYTFLLKELRQRFDQEEKILHRKLYLSIATGAIPEFLQHTEMEKVQRYVDTINLMAYDYYEPGSDAVTGNHAPLFTDSADPKQISADRSVREYAQAGVPSAKIVLGVPFYGHIWGKVADHEHGLFQAGKPVPDAFAKYHDISYNMINHGYTRYWDQAAAVPYLYNPEKSIFVSYEDPESLTAKCKYVLDHRLGGVMFWDYSSDPSGVLLDTIDSQLHHNSTAKASSQ
jgi:chitinase